MLLRFTKSNAIAHIILVPLVAVLLWLQTFMKVAAGGVVQYGTFHMPIFNSFINYFRQGGYHIGAMVMALALLVVQAFIIVHIGNKRQLFPERTFMPAYFFLLISSMHIDLQKLHGALFTNIIILYAIDRLFSAIRYPSYYRHTFWASFLIAFSAIIYIKAGVFIVVVWLTIILLKRFSPREFLISVIGFLLPFFLAWSFYFLTQATVREFTITLALVGLLRDISYTLGISHYVFLGGVALIIGLASVVLLQNIRFKNIRVRNYFWALFFVFIIASGAYLLEQFSLELIVYIAAPVSFLITDFMWEIKKYYYGEGLLYFLLLLTVFVQLIN